MKVFILILLFLCPFPVTLAQVDPQVELLTRQVEFLENANSQAVTTYQMTLQHLQTYVSWVTGGGLVVGLSAFGLAVWQFNQAIARMVEKQVSERVAETIERQVEPLRQVVSRENIVGASQIAYLRPANQIREPPPEVKLLKDRQFWFVEFIDQVDQIRAHDVVVLDLMDLGFTEELIKEWLTRITSKLNNYQVLIVYVAGRSEAVSNMRETLDAFGVANVPLSLVSTCVDAVHIAYSLKRSS